MWCALQEIFWGVLWAHAAGVCCGVKQQKDRVGFLGGVPSSRGLVVPAVGAEVGEKIFKA